MNRDYAKSRMKRVRTSRAKYLLDQYDACPECGSALEHGRCSSPARHDPVYITGEG